MNDVCRLSLLSRERVITEKEREMVTWESLRVWCSRRGIQGCETHKCYKHNRWPPQQTSELLPWSPQAILNLQTSIICTVRFKVGRETHIVKMATCQYPVSSRLYPAIQDKRLPPSIGKRSRRTPSKRIWCSRLRFVPLLHPDFSCRIFFLCTRQQGFDLFGYVTLFARVLLRELVLSFPRLGFFPKSIDLAERGLHLG